MPYLGKQPARVPVTAADIPDDSITAAKIVDGAITIADIADDAVTADKLANSINTAIAANTAKTTNATHSGEVTGSGALTITADAVTGAKIADDAIDSEHIAADSIDAEHYAAGSVDATALGADCVTAAKIGDNVLNSEHYAAASIDNEHLADDAVGVAELSATGTASSSTFLRGDNSWTAVSTPITALNNATANELVTVGSTTTELDAEANLTFDGTDLTIGTGDIVFGTTGKGICLGVTSNTDANTLDDYEEGSWTVELKDTSDNEASYHNREGSYTKVGNRVHLNGNLYVSSASALSGGLYIKGLPFGSNQSAGVTWGELRQTTRGSGNVTMLGVLSGSQIELLKNDGNGRNNSSALDASAVGNVTQWIFNVTYRTNV
jgi:hypothetical protein